MSPSFARSTSSKEGAGTTVSVPGLDRSGEEDWVASQIRSMTSAWARGEQVRVEDLLTQRPGLSTENAIRLIYEEICIRREAGQRVATAQVVERFPLWKDELEILLGCDELLWPLTRQHRFPEVGERLGPFQLLAELGRGAAGKTYLASEPALADRLVALKVIPDDQDEHLSLARVQHTYIIPLFSEQAFPELNLRALCMPYLGGTSLARLLQAMEETPIADRSGKTLLDTLDRIQSLRPPSGSSEEGPYRRFLEQATYVEAVCWIAACLADGLQEAHARGLVHMDVKPSNVLIAGDGMPMLLDFHLARRRVKPGEAKFELLGGTPGWMAPEQAAALAAIARGEAPVRGVDHRADLFALGLLVCEALGGEGAAAEAAAGRPWHVANPRVSGGLAGIVNKCVAANPADRYGDAASLAEDLRRHLNNLPLRGAPNRSLRERWSKWRKREPWALARAVAMLTTFVAILGVGGLGVAFYRAGVTDAARSLDEGRRLCLERRFDDAMAILGRGLERAGAIPLTDELRKALRLQLQQARWGQRSDELRQVADLVRFWHGTSLPAGKGAESFARRIYAIWAGHDQLLGAEADQDDPGIQRRVKTDLRELAIVWASLRVGRSSGPERLVASREALEVLSQVERVCGPSPALQREQRLCEEAVGRSPSGGDRPLVPQTPFEHEELGRYDLRGGRIREAESEFRAALETRPQEFWPNFGQGRCAFELGDYAEAVSAFRTCIALAPDSAECYYNRARAYDALGRAIEARADYGRALERNPRLASAALSRGILSYKTGQHLQAIADFERAIRAEPDAELLGRVYYNLTLAQLALGDRRAASSSVQQAARLGHPQASELRQKLLESPLSQGHAR